MHRKRKCVQCVFIMIEQFQLKLKHQEGIRGSDLGWQK